MGNSVKFYTVYVNDVGTIDKTSQCHSIIELLSASTMYISTLMPIPPIAPTFYGGYWKTAILIEAGC